MDRIKAREIVLKYIESYNNSDTDSMCEIMHKDLVFKNIVNNETIVETHGVDDFTELVKNSFAMFSEKEKKMITIAVEDNIASVEIFLDAVLAKDIEDQAFKGDNIRIEGYTEFEFTDNSLIKAITDYSR